MDNNSQSNDNELQKAIDDITKSAANESADDAVSELEAKIQNQLGTPPAPAMPEGMPTMPVAEPAPVVPAAETQPVVEAPVANIAPQVEEVPQAAPAVGGPVLTPSADFTVPVQEVPATVENPSVGIGQPVEQPVVSSVGGDLASIKEAMMRDLFPLMDKVQVEPEQKYEIFKEMIETTNDKSMIAGAYEAAKGLTDETAKAEALLYLIKRVDG